jgi:hypothetical protein
MGMRDRETYRSKSGRGRESRAQREDFAESVATYLYSGEAQDFLKDYFPKEKYPSLQYSDFKNTSRGKYVEYLLNH